MTSMFDHDPRRPAARHSDIQACRALCYDGPVMTGSRPGAGGTMEGMMGAQTVESLAERVEGFQDEAYDSLGIDGLPGGEEGERLERRVVGHVAALLERDPVIRLAPRAMLAAAVPLIEDDNAHCAAQALSDFLDKAGETDGRGE